MWVRHFKFLELMLNFPCLIKDKPTQKSRQNHTQYSLLNCQHSTNTPMSQTIYFLNITDNRRSACAFTDFFFACSNRIHKINNYENIHWFVSSISCLHIKHTHQLYSVVVESFSNSNKKQLSFSSLVFTCTSKFYAVDWNWRLCLCTNDFIFIF